MIEFSEYVKGRMVNEVGICWKFKMKGEGVIWWEVEGGEDWLLGVV